MKTAISLPDSTFERAERAAQHLGLSRSELYARAVDSYVTQLDRTSVTERLNAAIERTGRDDDTTDAVVAAGRKLIAADGEDW